ncbi:MAG: DUF6444 domain-containing protein [Desulfobacterales bacterium]|nr:DUF6444 domain-containing protein [Desulfobacterales bacterium]
MLKDLQQKVQENEKRIEKLEARTRQNSQNSSKPPSSDSPYERAGRKKKETCRLRAISTFRMLEQCIESYFGGTQPDLSWI